MEKYIRTLRARPELLTRPLFGIGIFYVWEMLIRITGTPAFVMPGPIIIAQTLWRRLIVNGFVLPHLWTTLQQVVVGYILAVIAGVALGTMIAQSRIVRKTFRPYLIAFGAVPKIALAPLFIIWFGFGVESKIAMSAVIAFFPLLINTISGLNSADSLKLELFKSLGATSWQTFRMLKVPNAMPYIFAGLKVAAVFAVSGAIIGEFVGSQAGLGHLALRMQYEFDIPGYFAVLFVIAPLGLALNFLVAFAQKRVVFWAGENKDK